MTVNRTFGLIDTGLHTEILFICPSQPNSQGCRALCNVAYYVTDLVDLVGRKPTSKPKTDEFKDINGRNHPIRELFKMRVYSFLVLTENVNYRATRHDVAQEMEGK